LGDFFFGNGLGVPPKTTFFSKASFSKIISLKRAPLGRKECYSCIWVQGLLAAASFIGHWSTSPGETITSFSGNWSPIRYDLPRVFQWL
jgi:hypothetical protein